MMFAEFLVGRIRDGIPEEKIGEPGRYSAVISST
jgi:hypothetical protein